MSSDHEKTQSSNFKKVIYYLKKDSKSTLVATFSVVGKLRYSFILGGKIVKRIYSTFNKKWRKNKLKILYAYNFAMQA